MANRHLSRSIVLQTLFECDIRDYERKISQDILIRNITEFGGGTMDTPFMVSLLENVLGKKTEVDKIIEKAAPDWPIDKISIVDRNVLRIGLTELIFADRTQVPAKVAINEAIELAKNFGGESSGKFVNGVMGAVYKELGEPGKDETTKKKDSLLNENMPIERKAGAVVFSRHEGEIYIALVHDVFGHWTLSKGSPEENESDDNAAVREIKEEIGIDIKIIDKLGENAYIANHPEKGKIKRQVTYFLAESNHENLTLGESGGLDDARWFKLTDILDLNFYDDILEIVTLGIKKIAKITESVSEPVAK